MPYICTFNLEKISTYINEFINLEINTIRIITILVNYDFLYFKNKEHSIFLILIFINIFFYIILIILLTSGILLCLLLLFKHLFNKMVKII